MEDLNELRKLERQGQNQKHGHNSFNRFLIYCTLNIEVTKLSQGHLDTYIKWSVKAFIHPDDLIRIGHITSNELKVK